MPAKREVFLAGMAAVVPWLAPEAGIEPHYPSKPRAISDRTRSLVRSADRMKLLSCVHGAPFVSFLRTRNLKETVEAEFN